MSDRSLVNLDLLRTAEPKPLPETLEELRRCVEAEFRNTKLVLEPPYQARPLQEGFASLDDVRAFCASVGWDVLVEWCPGLVLTGHKMA